MCIFIYTVAALQSGFPHRKKKSTTQRFQTHQSGWLTRALTYRRHWGYSLPWWPRWMQRLLVAGRSKRCHWAVDTGRAWGQRAAHSHWSRCCWHWCAGFWRPAAGCWDPWSDLVERKSTRHFFMILLCSGWAKKNPCCLCVKSFICVFFFLPVTIQCCEVRCVCHCVLQLFWHWRCECKVHNLYDNRRITAFPFVSKPSQHRLHFKLPA